jgi:hypothetical protein
MVQSIPQARPILIRHQAERYYVHVQVLGAGAIRIGKSMWELLTPLTGGVNQGQVIASADGVQRFWWKGELWAVGEGGDAQADFQFA